MTIPNENISTAVVRQFNSKKQRKQNLDESFLFSFRFNAYHDRFQGLENVDFWQRYRRDSSHDDVKHLERLNIPKKNEKLIINKSIRSNHIAKANRYSEPTDAQIGKRS